MTSNTKPIEEVRIGLVKAAIWRNQTDKGARFNVTFSRIYKNGDGSWKSTSSFGRDDLLLVAKVANEAHSVIHAYTVDQEAGKDDAQQAAEQQVQEQAGS